MLPVLVNFFLSGLLVLLCKVEFVFMAFEGCLCGKGEPAFMTNKLLYCYAQLLLKAKSHGLSLFASSGERWGKSQAARQLILVDLSLTKRETHGPLLGVCLFRRHPTRVQRYVQPKTTQTGNCRHKLLGLRKHGKSM